MAIIIGYDIGGAHLKCARIENGQATAVRQVPCPLWLGLDHLQAAFGAMRPLLTGAVAHAATMTGELAENFGSRREGVRAIAEAFARAAAPQAALIYAGPAGFVQPEAAGNAYEAVASANWHASAQLIAGHVPQALFVDTGSTTSDIIPVNGRVAARGYGDAERLQTGELVYTGVVRTSLMAIAAEAPFDGRMQRIMAENFSTAADIYRLTGELHADDDHYPASDGRGKTAAECRARLARMLGRDAASAPDAAWDGLARFFRERQLMQLYRGASQVLSGAGLAADAPVIGAGAGEFLIRSLAARLMRPYVTFADFVNASEPVRRSAGVCATAISVAVLAGAHQDWAWMNAMTENDRS